MSLRCLISHKWEVRPSELGCYGMGLETFETQQCGRCFIWRDRLKGLKPDGKSHYPWSLTDRPAIDWRKLPTKELANLCGIIDCRDGAKQSERDAAIQTARKAANPIGTRIRT